VALTATLTGGSAGVSLQWQIGVGAAGPWSDIPNATNKTAISIRQQMLPVDISIVLLLLIHITDAANL
jgi:hypothetical protein